MKGEYFWMESNLMQFRFESCHPRPRLFNQTLDSSKEMNLVNKDKNPLLPILKFIPKTEMQSDLFLYLCFASVSHPNDLGKASS